jgi:hypothetical protein
MDMNGSILGGAGGDAEANGSCCGGLWLGSQLGFRAASQKKARVQARRAG